MITFKQTQKHFAAVTLTGYAIQLSTASLADVTTVSQAKGAHFETLARSGQLGALMQGSRDHIGYAYSQINAGQLTYFAGANTTAQPEKATQQVLPAGEYLVLTAQGGYDRPLFDELLTTYFKTLQPQQPTWPAQPAFVVENLLNGQPQAASVAVRIPLF